MRPERNLPHMPTKENLSLELKRSVALNRRTHLLTLDLGADRAARCRPGQFFNIRVLDSSDPLLRRPISICDARPEDGEMDLLVRVVGKGTETLVGRRRGTAIDAVGPLGRWFEADPSRPALMIAGGVGVAPLYSLTRWLRRRARETDGEPRAIRFCYGARTAGEFVLLDEIGRAGADLILTTEDGTRGARCCVTAAAEALLDEGCQIFVCGPSPMMNATLRLLQDRGLRGQLSLENQMGCGVGACQGCVVPGREGHLRVCSDGPVVWSDALESVMAG